MSIVVYSKATGKALRLHHGSRRMLQLARARVRDGEAVIEGEFESIAGMKVEGGALVPAEVTDEEAMRDLRARRNQKLAAHVDSMNPIRWEAMTAAEKAAWRKYRQALLDLPANTKDPHNPKWPTPPGERKRKKK